MRVMRLHALGEALRLDEAPIPEPGPGQLRLRVLACGVNFADTLMVAGRYQEKPTPPFAPGLEVCGVVDAQGAETPDAPAIGTRVMASVGHGGMAEYVLSAANACAPAPSRLSNEQAAATPVAYGSSHVALEHRAQLRPGERLLVTGAAGGVGLTAVEIGKLMGAEVIAAARGAERLRIARAKGAKHLIDTDTQDLRNEVKALGGADVVYDSVGGDLWKAALRSANFEARLLPIGFASGEVPRIPANILLVKNVTVLGLYWGAYFRERPEVLAASFRKLCAWFDEGALETHVSNILPLEQANDALELLRSRQATGKVALRIAEFSAPAFGAR